MEVAPQDGREIIARHRRYQMTFRVAWAADRWVNDGFPLPFEFD